MKDFEPKNTFSFHNFLETLVGETTHKTALEIIDLIKTKKLKINRNSLVLISQVSSYKDKETILFLPDNYTFDDAKIEYPRILPEILRHTRNLSKDRKFINEIEKKIRLEAQNQLLDTK